jgi:hypothetical protein
MIARALGSILEWGRGGVVPQANLPELWVWQRFSLAWLAPVGKLILAVQCHF